MRFPHRLHLKELLDHYFLWGDKRSTAEVLAGEPGHVRVYKIAKNGGTVWEQVGEDIDGEDFSGNSVSLIHDGTNYVVAIGAPNNVRVYKISKNGTNGTAWAQVGEDIDGGRENFPQETSVSLIHEGGNYVVAIGSPNGNTIRLVELDSGYKFPL